MPPPTVTMPTLRTVRLGNVAGATAIRAKIWRSSALQNPRLIDGVFEGGGALGAAYVGSLRSLHDNNIWFARVVGNSAGSILAGMIAAGFTAPEIQWLCSGFADPPPRPLSLTGFNPIRFASFLDTPRLEDVSVASRRKTLLWQFLNGSLIDLFLNLSLPVPVQGDMVNGVMAQVAGVPLIGPIIAGNADVRGAFRGVLNAVLAPLPNDNIRLRHFVPSFASERALLADALWLACASVFPQELLLTNLLHEGGLFEGRVFQEEYGALLGRRVNGNAGASPTFADLTMPFAVIGTNLDSGSMEVYSTSTTPSMLVSEAVRRSMSVPFAFQPRASGGDMIVDGGLCSNFPAWLLTDSASTYFPADANASARPKLGVLISDKSDAPAGWQVQAARYTDGRGRAEMPDNGAIAAAMLKEKMRVVLADDVYNAARQGLAGFNVVLPRPPGDGLDQLGELAFFKVLSGFVGVDKESVAHDSIIKAVMAPYHYVEARIPLRGFSALEFDINESEDDLLAMWDRAWHATETALRATPPGRTPFVTGPIPTSPFRVA